MELKSTLSRVASLPFVNSNPVDLGASGELFRSRLRQDWDDSLDRGGSGSCSSHQEKSAEYYCRDCRVRLCDLCWRRLEHNSHDCTTASQIVEEKIDNVAAVMQRFCGIKTQIEHVAQLCGEQRSNIARDRALALSEMEGVFAALHEQVDAYQSELAQELQHVVDSCLSRLQHSTDQLTALHDDAASVADLTLRSASAFQCYNLFELEEFVQQKLVRYSSSQPLASLRPNRLSIQLKWTSDPVSAGKPSWQTVLSSRPLAKVNCHLSPERLSLLQTVTLRQQQQDRRPPHIGSLCCAFDTGTLFLCDTANNKVKVLNSHYTLDRCFVGSGKYKLIAPSSAVCFSTSAPPRKTPSSFSDRGDSVGDTCERQCGVVLISDPGAQKVVSFNRFGQGVHVFETNGTCEALCTVPRLADVANYQDSCLELLPVYQSGEVRTRHSGSSSGSSGNEVDKAAQTHQYTAEPAALLCSQLDQTRLECLQVNPETGRLYKSRPDVTISALSESPQFRPCKVAWNSVSSLLFILDSRQHKLLLISGQDGTLFREYGHYGSGSEQFNCPSDLLVDRQGQVLVADRYNHRLHLLDSVGNLVDCLWRNHSLHPFDICEPTALCFDEEGNLVICEAGGLLKVYTY